MTQAAKSQEPSMEEILASIRRIIADDDTRPPSAPPAAAPAPPPVAPAPPPRQAAPPPPPPVAPPPAAASRNDPASILKEAALRQDDIDMMLKGEAAGAQAIPAGEETVEVLNLTEAMITAPPEPSAPPIGSFQTIDGEPDVVFSEPTPPPPAAPARPYADETRPPPQAVPERPLLSSATSAAVDSAFNTLAHTVLVQNARTLEDLVREMLRPMLKTWLDDNLPGIVERMVRAEIERVSRGRS
jgi:cell pole-organizing protein PopZ